MGNSKMKAIEVVRPIASPSRFSTVARWYRAKRFCTHVTILRAAIRITCIQAPIFKMRMTANRAVAAIHGEARHITKRI